MDVEEPPKGHENQPRREREELGAIAQECAEEGLEGRVAEDISVDDLPSLVLLAVWDKARRGGRRSEQLHS